MNIKTILHAVLQLVTVALFVACEKFDDFSKISKDYQYQAKFSSILGHTSMTLDEFGIDLPFFWKNAPEELLPIDTVKLRTVIDYYFTDTAKYKDKVAQIKLFIDVENEFPEEIMANVMLSKDGKTPFQELKPVEPIVVPAAKSAGGVVSEKGRGTIVFVMTRADVNNWLNMKYLIVDLKLLNKTKLPLSEYQYFSSYVIGLEIYTQIDFDFNVSELAKK